MNIWLFFSIRASNSSSSIFLLHRSFLKFECNTVQHNTVPQSTKSSPKKRCHSSNSTPPPTNSPKQNKTTSPPSSQHFTHSSSPPSSSSLSSTRSVSSSPPHPPNQPNPIPTQIKNGSFFIGAKRTHKRFVRLTIEHIAVNWNGDTAREKQYLDWMGGVLREAFGGRKGWSYVFFFFLSYFDVEFLGLNSFLTVLRLGDLYVVLSRFLLGDTF